MLDGKESIENAIWYMIDDKYFELTNYLPVQAG